MGLTSSRWVNSGFFRVHLWVLMGLNTLASLAIITQRESLSRTTSSIPVVLGIAIGLAVASYVGATLWLYERATAGRAVLFMIMLSALVAAWLVVPQRESANTSGFLLEVADLVSSGLLLGFTLSAMFLGHWYLNTPTMELLPLKRLVMFMAVAIVGRALINGVGLGLQVHGSDVFEGGFWIFVALRWLSGLIGTFLLAVMSWYALKVPNTQSATGILYAGVILAFIGELTSEFLSLDALYPL